MADRIDVMISSTARDLPTYRKEVMDAILRMSMHPIAMEHLTAMNEDAIDASLAMVDEAEIYLGIFAHRYGYIPDSPKNPDKISITELEFRRATERNIPRLIFIMDESVPVAGADMEKDPDGAAKLLRLKAELGKSFVVGFFKTPEDLREQVVTALAKYRTTDIAGTMHYVRDIPEAPAPYIAHPYTLLQTSQLVGRQPELKLLTEWAANATSSVYQARVFNVVAIGGMGKSALTWKWFNDIAPLEMKALAGRMWWSFYESDAYFENFITRALAYVSKKSSDEIKQIPTPEREEKLLNILNEQPFLLVLDGLERILIAYARMDAAYLADDELDKETANYVAQAIGLPESAAQSFTGQHRLRKTADPRAGSFLRKLTHVRASRILISTRLYPADLQDPYSEESIKGSLAIFLHGLPDEDALNLWRDLGVSGSREDLLPLFHTFQNYPLLIRALAGEIKRDRRARGDFYEWRKNNPTFDPLKLPAVQVKTHVLQFALQGLDEQARKVLDTVAAFRTPASYDTLAAVLVGEKPSSPNPFSPEEKGNNAPDERFWEMASQTMVHVARDLRQRQTPAETILWECLRDRRLGEIKFRRQHPIPDTTYVVDFFTEQSRLIIELDGEIHHLQQSEDRERQQKLESLGYAILRFPNETIFNDLQNVLAQILERNSLLLSPNSYLLPSPGGEGQGVRAKLFATERDLDTMLAELEDRGLLGWDKTANRYDLHPIVRGVTWDTLDAAGKRGVYENLHAHFEAVPDKFADDYTQVNSLEDLTPAIELYNTLIGMGRYDDAFVVFHNRIGKALLYRLNASRQRAELLEMLFPDGLDKLPRLPKPSWQAFTLNALAQAYQFSGQPVRATPLLRLNVRIREGEGNPSVGLHNLSDTLRLLGGLREAEYAARRALVITCDQEDHIQESTSLYWLGVALAVRGIKQDSGDALNRSLGLAQGKAEGAYKAYDYLAMYSIWFKEYNKAQYWANKAMANSEYIRYERGIIRAVRLQGEAVLGLNDFSMADERLHHALSHARAVNLVEEELPALIALSELARCQSEPDKARERLDEVWEAAERGPYPLFHADALNVLAQIERDRLNSPLPEGEGQGVRAKAVKAATEAYTKAWCDGISADGKTCYAYWWGLQKAKAHLEALGATVPVLPPFDESKFEPLPEVEINPKDEFWVDPDKLDEFDTRE